MISSRWTTANALPVTIRPPFEEREKAVMVCSSSPASRTLNGLTSTPSDGATAWMAPNWPMPEAMAGSRMTAALVTFGAIFFEQLQPFPAQAILELAKSGNIAARPCEASDEARADRINNQYKHNRQGAGGLKQRWQNGGASGQNNIRRERHQFRNVTWIACRIAAAPAIVDLQVASYLPPQVPSS